MTVFIKVIPRSFVVYDILSHESHVSLRYQENVSEKWDIPWYTTKERWATVDRIPCHRKYSDQYNQCDIRAAHDGKVGCNTVEHTTAFLNADWLYFSMAWYKIP